MTTEENNKKTQSEKPIKKWYENTKKNISKYYSSVKKILSRCFSSGKFLILLIILLIISICYPHVNKLLDLLLSHLRSSFIIVLILFIIINLIFFLKKLKKRTNKIEKNKNTILFRVNALKSSDSCKQFISYFIKTTRYFLSFIFNFFILASLTIIFLDSLMKKELSFNHADKPFYVMFFTYVTMAIFVYNHFFQKK